MTEPSLKLRTARSVKWNAIDRMSSQVLYAITGLVLANKLTPDDFGLVGAILIFQSFASLLIDSGFSYALIQRKSPTRLDYSSVLWFNLGIATMIYIILWFSAPLIAHCFKDDLRLIPLSRVMFITFILNASSIVQVNHLTKQMNVRPVAVANISALTLSGIAGIYLAISGYGAWAIVWQSIVNTGSKSAILWCTSHWLPVLRCSWTSLKSFFSVGGSMMFTSFLNTIFQTIYSFFIGHRLGMAPLGYYTQGDKWSKMGIMSIQQTLTSSFLPALSDVQDDRERFRRLCSKMNRMTAYLLFPLIAGLIIMAPEIFHILFGDKWNASIVLFQLLLTRGVFTITTNNYNNYILALGKSRMIMMMEIVRDGTALVALVATLPFLSLSTPTDMLYGIKILLWGQVAAAIAAWAVTLICACRITGAKTSDFLRDMAPYLIITALIGALLYYLGSATALQPIGSLIVQSAVGVTLYVGVNTLLKSRIQHDVLTFIMGKMKK